METPERFEEQEEEFFTNLPLPMPLEKENAENEQEQPERVKKSLLDPDLVPGKPPRAHLPSIFGRGIRRRYLQVRSHHWGTLTRSCATSIDGGTRNKRYTGGSRASSHVQAGLGTKVNVALTRTSSQAGMQNPSVELGRWTMKP